MKAPSSTARPLDEATRQAATWFSRLRADDVTGADRAAFQEWLQQDFEHRAAYERFERLWSKTGAYAGTKEVAQAVKGVQPALRFRWWWAASAAGIVALTAALALAWLKDSGHYETKVGERRVVALDDGSRVTLNTDTELQVRYSERTRVIELARGEAYFSVAPDEARPFTVVARHGTVQALGTKFQVYEEGQQLRVTLVEGKVSVTRNRLPATSADLMPAVAEPVILAPGEMVTVSVAAPALKRTAAVEQQTSWLNGKLVFDDETLNAAVTEANRYSKDKISIGDASLRDLRISGVYRADEPEEFVRAIAGYFDLEARREGTGWRLVRAAGATH